jgi:hypothetical protein
MLQVKRSLTIIWFSRVAAASIAGEEIAVAAARVPRTKFNLPRARQPLDRIRIQLATDIDVELFELPAKNMFSMRAIPDFGEHR